MKDLTTPKIPGKIYNMLSGRKRRASFLRWKKKKIDIIHFTFVNYSSFTMKFKLIKTEDRTNSRKNVSVSCLYNLINMSLLTESE